nr:hypothetical protein [Tanacetum cinerariifolium]
MTSFGYRLNSRYTIKECSSCGTLYTRDCCCSKGNVEDKILVPKLLKIFARCARCGHPVDGPYCQGCTLLQKELEEDLVTYFQYFQNTSESSDDSTNVVNAPREPFVVKQDHGDGEVCQRCTCTRCGSGLSKGLCYICGNNQNSLNDSPRISENSSQSPPHINHYCCYECGDPLDASRFYDNDDDEERSNSLKDNIISRLPPCSAITPNEPVLSIEEPDNSLSMGDEHLDIILATESDEVIESSVENLILIPSEFEGIPEHMCDVPFHDNSPPLDVSKYQFENFSDSNDEFSLTDDDSFSINNIDYVEASPPDSELVSSEVMKIVIPE